MYLTRIEDLAHRMSEGDGSVPVSEELKAQVDFLDQKTTAEEAA